MKEVLPDWKSGLVIRSIWERQKWIRLVIWGLRWEKGELISCIIDSFSGKSPKVRYKGREVDLSLDGRFAVHRRKCEKICGC